jgi:hypothetical protein
VRYERYGHTMVNKKVGQSFGYQFRQQGADGRIELINFEKQL